MKRKIEDKTYPGHLTDSHAKVYDKYCKIPIISPGVHFWSKGLFTKFFLRVFIFGGGGYMDGYLHFENAIYCFHNRNFLRFYAHNLSLIQIFFYSKYNPRGLIFGGGGALYMEGVFHFKSWFLNAPGLIHSRAYYQNFTVPCRI